MGMASVFWSTGILAAQHWWRILLLTPVLLFPAAIYLLAPIPAFEDFLGFFNYGDEIGSVFDMFVPLLLASPLKAAFLFVTFQANAGLPPHISQGIIQGFSRAIPVFAITALILVSATIGSVFFLLPGIFVFVILILSPAVCIAENQDVIGSLQRSWHLSHGYRWKLFGLIAILFFIGKLASNAPEVPGALIYILLLMAEPIIFGVAYLQIKNTEEP